MKISGLNHYALSFCLVAVMLAACGGSQPPIGAPGAMPTLQRSPALAQSAQQLIRDPGSFTSEANGLYVSEFYGTAT